MPRLAPIAAALLAAALLAAPAAAQEPDPVADRFHAASLLVGEDRHEEAAAALEAIAREAPDHRLAPEALFTAGELREDRLAQPARALALYEQIERAYPDSRPAVAAARRAARLRRQVGEDGGGAEPQRRFAEIQQGFASRSEAESIAMGDQLLADYPDWPGGARVALWLAEVELRAGRTHLALRRYAAAAETWSDPDIQFEAHLGAGDAALQLGRLDLAERHYRSLDPRGDVGRQTVTREALAAVATARERAGWSGLAWFLAGAGLVVLLGSLLLAARSARRAARALWPPPPEVLYFAPVGLVLAVTGYTDYQGLGPAVSIVAAGGLVTAWVSGAGLQLRRVDGRRPVAAVLVHVVASAAVVIGLTYLAIYYTGLLTAVLDTLRDGPDR